MIMDEPTNHLDIDTVEGLAQALRLIFDDHIFYLDDEGIALTQSFVVITIDVNKNVAIMLPPREFKGGVVLVSHDQNLLQSVCHQVSFSLPFQQKPIFLGFFLFSPAAELDITAQVWVCQGGTVKVAQGGVHEYKRKVEKAFAATK